MEKKYNQILNNNPSIFYLYSIGNADSASGEILKSNSNSTLEEFSPLCVHEQYVNYLRKLVLAYPDIKKVRKTELVCQDCM